MNCKKCKTCTKHRYDEEKQAWVRCENADLTLFHKELKTVPKAYMHKSWSDWTADTPQRKVAQEWASTIVSRLVDGVLPKLQVVFTGPPNSGKTLLTSILARQLILKSVESQFVSLDNLIDCFFNDRDSYYAFTKPKCLIVQITNEPNSNAAQLVLNSINRERILNSCYTIYTVNCPVRNLKDRFSKEVQDFFEGDNFKELSLPKYKRK